MGLGGQEDKSLASRKRKQSKDKGPKTRRNLMSFGTDTLTLAEVVEKDRREEGWSKREGAAQM